MLSFQHLCDAKFSALMLRTRNIKITILFNSGQFLLCDHIINFTSDVNIPNINLYNSVFASITYGSKK